MPKLKLKTATTPKAPRKPRTKAAPPGEQVESKVDTASNNSVAAKSPAKKRGRRPATENTIPKVKAIKSRHFGEEAIKLAILIKGMIDVTLARFGNITEIRGVTDQFQVILNSEAGLPCRNAYRDSAEIDKILKLAKKVPTEFWPAKWTRFVDKLGA